jgi:hypothetical protein
VSATAGDRRRRARLIDVFLVLLLAWLLGGFVWLATVAHGEWRQLHTYRTRSDFWRFGMRQPERLRRCLAGTVRAFPDDAVVYLYGDPSQGYRWMWATYMLPERRVWMVGEDAPSGIQVISTARDAPPRGELVFGGRWCGVYRLR